MIPSFHWCQEVEAQASLVLKFYRFWLKVNLLYALSSISKQLNIGCTNTEIQHKNKNKSIFVDQRMIS